MKTERESSLRFCSIHYRIHPLLQAAKHIGRSVIIKVKCLYALKRIHTLQTKPEGTNPFASSLYWVIFLYGDTKEP